MAKTQAPVAQSKATTSPKPKITQTTVDSCRIRHTEMMDNVVESGSGNAFKVTGYRINPADDDTFSWLSNVAINWETYVFHSLSFEYRTRTTTSNSGSLMMAIDYDAVDVLPVDELTLMSYSGARQDAIWKDLKITANLPALHGGVKRHYNLATPNGIDPKSYDCGTFMVATDNLGSGVIGKLFVHYDITFYTPQLPPTGDPLVGSVRAIQGGTQSLAAPLGTAPSNAVTNTLGSCVYNASVPNNTITLLRELEEGLMDFSAAGTGLSTLGIPTLTSVAGTVTRLSNEVVNAAGTNIVANFVLKKLQKGDVITFPTVTGTTLTSAAVNGLAGIVGTYP